MLRSCPIRSKFGIVWFQKFLIDRNSEFILTAKSVQIIHLHFPFFSKQSVAAAMSSIIVIIVIIPILYLINKLICTIQLSLCLSPLYVQVSRAQRQYQTQLNFSITLERIKLDLTVNNQEIGWPWDDGWIKRILGNDDKCL